jgi:hypothetical protein
MPACTGTRGPSLPDYTSTDQLQMRPMLTGGKSQLQGHEGPFIGVGQFQEKWTAYQAVGCYP